MFDIGKIMNDVLDFRIGPTAGDLFGIPGLGGKLDTVLGGADPVSGMIMQFLKKLGTDVDIQKPVAEIMSKFITFLSEEATSVDVGDGTLTKDVLKPLVEAVATVQKAIIDLALPDPKVSSNTGGASGDPNTIPNGGGGSSTKASEAIHGLIGKLAVLPTDRIIRGILSVVQNERLLFGDGKNKDKPFGNYPVAIMRGPVDALKLLGQVGDLLALTKTKGEVTRRGHAVFKSLEELSSIVMGHDEKSLLFQLFVDGAYTKFKELLNNNGDPLAIGKALSGSTVFPLAMFVDFFKEFNGKSLGIWNNLPGGLAPGALHQWINDPTRFANGADLKLQREFRVRLIAAYDNYFRSRLTRDDAENPLNDADFRTSEELIGDLIAIFFDVSILFVLEPECYPQTDLDWPNFEDLGFEWSKSTSIQIRLQIRMLVGTLLRGVWEFSVHNGNLCEALGTILGSIFSATLEGLVRQLAWTLEIRTRYKGSDLGTGVVTLYDWESLERVCLNGDPLEYVAVLRANWADGSFKDLLKDNKFEMITNVVKDIGAYMDIANRRALTDTRLRDDVYDEVVTITRAERDSNGRIRIWATTDRAYEKPQPVLRAYCCCNMVVLKPGAKPSASYTCEFDTHSYTQAGRITVRSNYGGRAVASVRSR